jgi:haloalkane dehalogenase
VIGGALDAPDVPRYPGYPFHPRRVEVRPGVFMSCVDEGPRDGEVVLMLHGNPSWSYYWRRLVVGLRGRYRCLAPDHVGMGLSDKPDDGPRASPRYDYTLESRVEDIDALLRDLKIDGPVTLAVHDWGGMIGLGWALRNPDRVRRLIVLNTATFPLPATKPLPFALRFGRESRIAALLIRGFNAFASIASHVGVCRSMPGEIRRAYVAPYDSWRNRIGTLRFVQDIPLAEGDPAWPLVAETGRRLREFAHLPSFIAWGLADFVFDERCLDVYRDAWPRAQVHTFSHADHYVLEDEHALLVPKIREFLERHPLEQRHF